MLLRVSLALLSLALVSTLAYWEIDQSVLMGLRTTTTARIAVVNTPALTLLEHVVTLGGIAYILALVGFIFLARKRSAGVLQRPDLFLAILLYGSSLLAPAYHIYKSELVSLDKHMAFSIFFIVPLAGYALSSISGYRSPAISTDRPARRSHSRGRYWLTGLALCLVVFLIGTRQADDNYAQWEYTGNLIHLLHTQVQPGSGHYLVEEYDVSRYYMQDVTSSWQWCSLDFFGY